MATIKVLEDEIKEHSNKLRIIVEEPSKIATMLALRWEFMQQHQMSVVISLSILPLLESMNLVYSPKSPTEYGSVAIEFRDFHEQTGEIRTLRWMTGKACTYHNDLRREGYYNS